MLAVALPVATAEARASGVAKLNCAGRGCPEREGCRRFETRISVGKRVAANGYELKTYTWASFDVERARFGDCPARIRQVMR